MKRSALMLLVLVASSAAFEPSAASSASAPSSASAVLAASAAGAIASDAEEPKAFELVTRTGELLLVQELADTPAGYLLRTDAGGVRLAPDSLDFYATFRRNQETGHGGNVLWFLGGRWMRFEKLAFEKGGRVRLELGNDAVVSLPEQVIDFRATVLESGPTLLPRGRAQLLVAKSTGPPPPERPSAPEALDDGGEGAGRSEEAEDAGGDDGRPGAEDLGRARPGSRRGLPGR